MTEYDRRILFMALSFITIMLSEKTTPEFDTDKILRIAQSLEAFCKQKVAQP